MNFELELDSHSWLRSLPNLTLVSFVMVDLDVLFLVKIVLDSRSDDFIVKFVLLLTEFEDFVAELSFLSWGLMVGSSLLLE